MRFKPLLVFLAVSALLMAAVGTAAAAKPCNPGHPENCPPPDTTTTQPSTTTTNPDGGAFGLTCAQARDYWGPHANELVTTNLDAEGFGMKSFDIPLTAAQGMACVDVYGAEVGTWTFEATWPAGTVRLVTETLRDSVPGDWCARAVEFRTPDLKGKSSIEWNLAPYDTTDPVNPPAGSTVNACGTQYRDASDIELVDGNWQVVPGSGTLEKTGEPHPLVLVLSYQGDAPEVTVHVTLP